MRHSDRGRNNKRYGKAPERPVTQSSMIGFVVKDKDGPRFAPSNKKIRDTFAIDLRKSVENFDIGDLVCAEVMKQAIVKQVLGHISDPKSISLIAIHQNGLKAEFPKDVLAETEDMTVPELGKRTDLRDIKLITIDGMDARDFDDAVFAEKTDDGYHILVAIADVSYYVRAGTALNREAIRRGNSTYFPDRVIPMLPERLSNDLCSLVPNQPRACMAVHMYIDHDGKLTNFKFVRGLMRSYARTTYEQIQKIHDTDKNDVLYPLVKNLYDAFAILDKARQNRNALNIDAPERKIKLDAQGRMVGVEKRERLDSHKVIEEMMILANVAAATALEAKKTPCVYRVHDKPTQEKMGFARDGLKLFGYQMPKAENFSTRELNKILEDAKESEFYTIINEMVLRSQTQAFYSKKNIGHFGLALEKYAHFTSPIRRYADLLVHRGLIRAYGLGDDGLSDEEVYKLDDLCTQISETERTSVEAERDATNRFCTAWLSEQPADRVFKGRINGITRFGVFVTLEENGADGLVPIRSLPHDYYHVDETNKALIGRRFGRVYRLGAPVMVKIEEADPATGSSVFEILNRDGADLPHLEKIKISRDSRRDDRGNRPPHDRKKVNKRKEKLKSGKPTRYKHKDKKKKR
ncbi:MAG: ribonuclease R [Alphaproteobacteria bacterium]|nr:ribonuclease R [Alphaproteobacteria bacterium]